MTPRICDALDPAVREQAVDQQAELVGRPLAQRLQPPALDERGAVEHAEHDVGVADVDREQHQQLSKVTTQCTVAASRQ